MKLKTLIAQYVAFRKSMGEECASAESVLKTFGRRLGAEIDLQDVRVEQVQAFLAGTGPVTHYWRRKYDTVRGLYHYATRRGLIAEAPLPRTVPKLPEHFVPYIYSREELHRLLTATASVPKAPRKLEPHTLRTIVLLLYGAGLRVSEAVALTLDDVDLSGAVITIRDTKFHKTRMLPLGPKLNQVMLQYLARRDAAGHPQSRAAPFFVLRRGGPVPVPLLEQRFRCLCEHAGVTRTDGARYQPRLHDLRHSFSVHRLTAWYQQGADVQTLLPQLATYLGHVTLAATQVYLTVTPELLHAASVRFERYAFPEVPHA